MICWLFFVCLIVCPELIEELAGATDLKFGMHVEHTVTGNTLSEKGDKMSWPIRFEALI